MHPNFVRGRVDLLLAGSAALLALALGALAGSGTPGVMVRTLTGLPLVFVLPGYALMVALFPVSRASAELSAVRPGVTRLERAVWSVGLSLALSALGGLALNYTPAGLVRLHWLALLCGVTVTGIAVAWFRQPTSHTTPHRAGLRVSKRAAAWWTGAGVVAACALTLGLVYPGKESPAGFTELWLVPDRATAAPGDAEVGIRNNEHSDQQYRVVIQRGRETISVRTLHLDAGETWREHITAPPQRHTEVLLYRPADWTPYREVALRPIQPAAGQ